MANEGVLERGRKRLREAEESAVPGRTDGRDLNNDDGGDLGDGKNGKHAKHSAGSKSREMSRRRRESSVQTVPGEKGLSKTKDRAAAAKALRKAQKAGFGKDKRHGEADRHTGPKLLKHMLAGKSGLGTSRSR